MLDEGHKKHDHCLLEISKTELEMLGGDCIKQKNTGQK